MIVAVISAVDPRYFDIGDMASRRLIVGHWSFNLKAVEFDGLTFEDACDHFRDQTRFQLVEIPDNK